MVSRTPTKPPPSPKTGTGSVTPSKSSPTLVARRCLALRRGVSPATAKRRGSPLKSLASAPTAVTASFDRSIRSCRRRLLKLFARLAVLGSSRKRRAAAAGFQRLRSSSAPPPPPLPSQNPAVRAQSAALPPLPSPGRRTLFLDLDETLIHSQTSLRGTKTPGTPSDATRISSRQPEPLSLLKPVSGLMLAHFCQIGLLVSGKEKHCSGTGRVVKL
ncbi:hypothetical protein Zm00014a_021862 [Zea mays]|uniref:Haloacid dehalogenase-like hydrolase (HAD) superfamily protein n=1 Tax=Zea mays TaxID=4577 RepID=A0A3L6DXV6_MAIZE|nr:hypothetical protein Zm00014a_021862 [Zea mays]